MRIGELINEFDNTNGTLEEFNRIFQICPLDFKIDKNSIIEIGEIVQVGDELKRYLTIDGILYTHCFKKEHRYNEETRQKAKRGNKSIRNKYKLVNVNTGDVYKATNLEELSAISGISFGKIRTISQGTCKDKTYNIIKSKL